MRTTKKLILFLLIIIFSSQAYSECLPEDKSCKVSSTKANSYLGSDKNYLNVSSISQNDLKYGNRLKKFAIALFSIGSAVAIAGGGIFISNRAFNGETSELIQYPLLIGGLSIIGWGLSTNFK